MIAAAPTPSRATAGSRGDILSLLELVRHDTDLFVHGLNVGRLAERMARTLGLADGHVAAIRVAAELHDIGKLAVPRSVLTKRGALTESERHVMERHPVVGAAILQLAGLPRHARWVRHHHERMDGQGYPDGLAGYEIPLASRIILAADAFDALTSDRPYRPAQSEDAALAELAAHSGSQFDPACIAVLVKVA
ncbi:MAG TPA: HD domain-containing phosphohydrolase [Thermoleophilaceae bacterium]